MIRIHKELFYILAVAFIAVSFTSAYFSDSVAVSSNTFLTGTSSHSDIALNEFMPDPTGVDNALMPDGEWIELYNKGNWSIDVNGWYLYDAINSHDLPIASSNVGGGSTVIEPHRFATIYRNGDSNFSLDNSGSETLRLYDGPIVSAAMIDSFTYSGSTTDKTWARVPNGVGSWLSNQTPTKGASN